jgi:ubiquinone/menaquinone biosynthesis C-methylase UbiE
MFDLYRDLPEHARILELGAGAGWLWLKNWLRIPSGWQITLSDFSAGMVEELRKNFAPIPRPFEFAEIDIQNIPYPDHSFDAVIANHMLYHVPDRPKAIAELRRVLKPTGTLFTATNGEHHLQEMHRIMARFGFQPEEYLGGFASVKGYTLENATAQLNGAFEQVELRRYEDSIVLTDPKPLVDYIQSFPVEFNDERLQALQTLVKSEFNDEGKLTITKDMGVLIAR